MTLHIWFKLDSVRRRCCLVARYKIRKELQPRMDDAFFIPPFPLPPISELPEREEGEGEETPNFSHWGPPRTYVHMVTLFLPIYLMSFSVSQISACGVFFSPPLPITLRYLCTLGFLRYSEFLTDVQQNYAFYLYS